MRFQDPKQQQVAENKKFNKPKKKSVQNKNKQTRNIHKTWSAGFECSLVELHPGTMPTRAAATRP